MAQLTLTFFKNHSGADIGDLHAGTRRLLATNHPATFVAAMWLMGRSCLTVTASGGKRTGCVRSEETGTPIALARRYSVRKRLEGV